MLYRRFPNIETIAALVIGGVVAFYFDFSTIAVIATSGFAFCVALVTNREVDRDTAKVLLIIAVLLFGEAMYKASMFNVGFYDMLALRGTITSVQRSMLGVYVFLIGAAFIEIAHRL